MSKRPPLPLLSFIAALPPLSIDMYLPALPGIAKFMEADTAAVQNSISIFLVGFGLGMLFFGPFSDRFGRKPMALFGLAGFALTSFLLGFCEQISSFLILRFIQAFVGSAATVVVPAIVRDTFGKDTSKGMSSVAIIMMIAPLVAPLMGSVLLAILNWQLIFHFLGAYGLLGLLVCVLVLPETRPEAVESLPASRMFSNYTVIFARKDIYFDLACFMLSSLAFFSYLTSVSFVFIDYFGVTETKFSLIFAFNTLALILANVINIRIVSRMGSRTMLNLSLITGSVTTLALCLLIMAGAGIMTLTIGFFLVITCLGISSVNANSLVLMEFPHQASTASAVIGTLRFGSGALAGPILAMLYDGSPLPTATLMLIPLILACLVQLSRKSLLRS